MDEKIDRYALVSRHNPVLKQAELLSPLSVGNGEFAYTVDITGLQSFPEQYQVPLGTQSQWGWHSSGGRDRFKQEDIQLKPFETYGRAVGYATDADGQEEAFHWLRQNPHRMQLAQIGLHIVLEDGSEAKLEDLNEVEQILSLWEGVITSRFEVQGDRVTVTTCCHPMSDQIGIFIESALLDNDRLAVRIGFPSTEVESNEWAESIDLNWNNDMTHHTTKQSTTAASTSWKRSMDDEGYTVSASWSDGQIIQESEHRYVLKPSGIAETLELAIGFSSRNEELSNQSFEDIKWASQTYWRQFWSEGGAVDFSGSVDERAAELERRVVLSQYQTAIHCSGSLPPQETGLLYNSWFGKFHLEMHWWHAAHFALWGRTAMLEKSLDWYCDILPIAHEVAKSQGYEGARWPKMVDPAGLQSPSTIGTLLIWQQPHPIAMAELCYRSHPNEETLQKYKEIVLDSAAFMASFAVWDEQAKRYVLGPPVIPAQENHAPEDTLNPTFELEYWKYGLEVAQLWRDRLGLKPDPDWEHICTHIAALPISEDGVYLAHEWCPDSFTSFNEDHPSMLGALGILPGKLVDREIMRRTLKKVITDWKWETAWGWDFPMAAMTAARLSEGNIAVDMLLMDQIKNTYFSNGHNYQRPGLTAYLPGNGGLLTAIAIMACGWEGSGDQHAPGFPQDGTWVVRCEGLSKII
ncbi:glycoside hydrolase family 65 [Paenibacillus sp. LMG 31456]|uniref:Glycoside hydrolase family 65 n=1 Tax=Paenibacillus foliorum TaxID=2654974 RepID=A0A972H7R5_9BACL|nr:glycoside hydrolase family 65 [Paenibacillus foliorum]NOU97951.1 glycoside hydrolase family 65 [Paenibacillus foliorum]